MMKINKVLATPATGAYYAADLEALRQTPLAVEDQYLAEPVTPGFRRVREVSEAVSVGLVLGTGSDDPTGPGLPAAWGDCVAVAYAGHAGRDPVFRTADGLHAIRDHVSPLLSGMEVTSFREIAAAVDAIREEVRVPVRPEPATSRPDTEPTGEGEGVSRRDLLSAPFRFLRPEGQGEREMRQASAPRTVMSRRPLHAAVRYGVSQAALQAVALTRNLTMAEVIADEWDLPQPGHSVPIHAQSGAGRHANADKMIVRRVDSLPHALVEDISTQLGEEGDELVRYARWLKERVAELGGSNYRPAIHLDVHGALGRIYDNNLGRILGYLYRLESSVQPLTLRIESPVIMGTRGEQIEALRTLREYAQFRSMGAQIVADEWANTLQDIAAFVNAEAADMIQIKMPDLGSVANAVDAVLVCQEAGVDAFLGGSCAETDLSARVAAHVALATQPAMVMAKPGMGVDEGVSLVQNEMTRTLVRIRARVS